MTICSTWTSTWNWLLVFVTACSAPFELLIFFLVVVNVCIDKVVTADDAVVSRGIDVIVVISAVCVPSLVVGSLFSVTRGVSVVKNLAVLVIGQVVAWNVAYSFVEVFSWVCIGPQLPAIWCRPGLQMVSSNSMGSFVEGFNSVNKLMPIEFVIDGIPLVARRVVGGRVINSVLLCDWLTVVELAVGCSSEITL